MRAVLDTNTVVSALIWGGKPFELLQAATDGDLLLHTSPALGHPHRLGRGRDRGHGRSRIK